MQISVLGSFMNYVNVLVRLDLYKKGFGSAQWEQDEVVI